MEWSHHRLVYDFNVEINGEVEKKERRMAVGKVSFSSCHRTNQLMADKKNQTFQIQTSMDKIL